MSEKAPFMVFSGTNSRYLAEKICASLDCPLGKMNITHFADGEFAVSYEESIRGSHVFLVQSTFPNSDNLMELLLMVDAAKRASAKSVVAVIPYFGWARQDRKDKPRVSIGAKLVADLLSIALVSAMGTSVTNMMLAISISNIPPFARIVRSAVLTIKNEEYIEAARAIGASDKRIILKHILPNCMAPIIVQATLSIAGSILAIASLSFIGLGISPPTPEWGSMVSTGRQYFRAAWWVCAFPGFAIMLTILSLNLLGDGLRDALDPKLKN